MGSENAGKTSMYSVIFANYPARDTMGIGYTVGIDKQIIRFMGSLTLNLWDCAGQGKLMKNYFNKQKDIIFKDVQVLIYVFDIGSQDHIQEEDLIAYKSCLEKLAELSEGAKVFVLLHKIDLIDPLYQHEVFEKKKKLIQNYFVDSRVYIQGFFASSIWNETLYKAWSIIVQSLVPNLQQLKNQLKQLCHLCEIDEIVLYEKSTFLVIAYYNMKETCLLNYERVSNVIKKFKLSCNLTGSKIQKVLFSSNVSCSIQEFNENSFIMTVYQDSQVNQAAIDFNIKQCRSILEQSIKNIF
ncbi:Gtr1/RagA G motif protein (macronuclear) [Tetrahymena thermophila SB210]|uniref:Gtr1/RagA G motif protein n=1 Tax=Tetrahymena thermophila (strain SB210) TaxID=312017 RepID=Q22TY8_TETTS|nr:Gtr1/RagA G motif protein [Tetrahymena thermophila SB210]EAR88899.1 Gtr1/RagA G motif protein [Tetrahymena thermophila SB210]|eukprot:XP_001009144.1 Gtr1/RagA G motif protein [Tetrahymena thermophila SB210]